MARFCVIRRTLLLKILSALCLGFILGTVTATVYMGHQIDQLTIEKENLHNELSSVKKELKQINENLKKRRAAAVNRIEANVTFPKDTFSKYEGSSLQMELEKRIVEMLQPLNGKEIEKIEPELVPQIVQGRKLTVENRDFYLQVQTVIISQQLKIFVLAKPSRVINEQGNF